MRGFLYATLWVRCFVVWPERSVGQDAYHKYEVIDRPAVQSLPYLVGIRISRFNWFEMEYTRPLGRLPKRNKYEGT